MLAGGVGGSSGDMLMHSIDTVKTRQQGDPHMPPKYGSLSSTYLKIFRQEGFRRGLYSGVTPAFMGSFPGTIIFFGTYEYSKRHLIDAGMNHSLAYLASGTSKLEVKLLTNADEIQASLPTSLLPLSTCPQKSLRLASNCKADTTIPSSIRAIITGALLMLLAQSYVRRAYRLSSTDTKPPSFETYHFPHCSSPSTNKSRIGLSSGLEAGISDWVLRLPRRRRQAGWLE